MNRVVSNILENCKRSFLVFATMFFVLFSSCPVKAAINNLTSEPITEQPASGHNSSLSVNFDRCSDSELAAMVTTADSSQMADLLPAVLLLSVAYLLFGFTFRKERQHPLYRNIRIGGLLPLFLEYRQLII